MTELRILTEYPPRKVPLDLGSPCVPWDGNCNPSGYGRVKVDGVVRYAHRLVYQLHVGHIPRTWEIDHVCHSKSVAEGTCTAGPCAHRACVNPAHLEAVSSRENSMRGGHPLFKIHASGKCSNGHDMTVAENVYMRPDGRPRCRICMREARRRWEKKRAHSDS